MSLYSYTVSVNLCKRNVLHLNSTWLPVIVSPTIRFLVLQIARRHVAKIQLTVFTLQTMCMPLRIGRQTKNILICDEHVATTTNVRLSKLHMIYGFCCNMWKIWNQKQKLLSTVHRDWCAMVAYICNWFAPCVSYHTKLEFKALKKKKIEENQPSSFPRPLISFVSVMRTDGQVLLFTAMEAFLLSSSFIFLLKNIWACKAFIDAVHNK